MKTNPIPEEFLTARLDNFEIPRASEIAPFLRGGLLEFAVAKLEQRREFLTCVDCGCSFLVGFNGYAEEMRRRRKKAGGYHCAFCRR